MINPQTPPDLPDSMPELSELVPDIPEDKFRQVHQKESIQLLGDLGYLDEELFYTGEEVEQLVFEAAIDQFRDELSMALSGDQTDLHTLVEQTGMDDLFEPPEHDLTNEEIQLLGECTALEGALDIPESLFDDQQTETHVSLFSRILHYRLHILFLYNGEVDEPINPKTHSAIKKLGKWIGVGAGVEDEYQIITLIGDITKLAERLCTFPPSIESTFKEVVYFRYERTSDEKEEHRKKELIKEHGNIFLKQLKKEARKSSFDDFIYQVLNGLVREYNRPISRLKKDIKTLTASIKNKINQIEAAESETEIKKYQQKIKKFNQELKSKEKKLAELEDEAHAQHHPNHNVQGIFFKKRDYSYVEHLEGEPLNDFMIRVLQLLAWTHGLYEGRLDNVIGDMTYDAIEKLIDFENSFGMPNTKRKANIHKVLIYLGKSYWALNITYFFELFVKAGKQEVTEGDSVSEVFDRLYEKDVSRRTSLTQAQKEEYIKNREKVRQELEKELKVYPKKLNEDANNGRRKYHGARKILNFFKRIGKKVVDIIKNVGRFFKRIFKMLKNGIAIIFNEIKNAFRKFYRGMKFLFSKRIINLPDNPITTDFDFDFDSLTTLTQQPSAEKMNAHLEKCTEYTISLQFSFRLLGKVINLAQSLKLGWVGLGLKIVGKVKSIIKKKLEEQKRFAKIDELVIPIF